MRAEIDDIRFAHESIEQKLDVLIGHVLTLQEQINGMQVVQFKQVKPEDMYQDPPYQTGQPWPAGTIIKDYGTYTVGGTADENNQLQERKTNDG